MANEPHLEIQFILGEDNVVADLLSRPSGGICVVTMKPSIEGRKNDTQGNRNDKGKGKND